MSGCLTVDDTPSLSSSATSQSVGSSEASPQLQAFSVLSPSTTTSTTSSAKSPRRTGFLGRSLHLASLLRSHSLSRGHTLGLQPTPANKDEDQDYASLHPVKDAPAMPNDVDERLSRKPKTSESKLYNFLLGTRSRSKSLTRQRKTSTTVVIVEPEVPRRPSETPSTSSSRSLASTASQSTRGRATPDKPKQAADHQSRPISSTTTATDATVTPSTPKPSRHISSTVAPTAGPSHQSPDAMNRVSTSTSRPSSPKSKSPSRKLHRLFSIGSRKSSLSRPSSPTPPTSRSHPLTDFTATPTPKLTRSVTPQRTSHIPDIHSTHGPRRGSSVKGTSDVTVSPAMMSAESIPKPDTLPRASKFFQGIGLRVSHPRPRASGSNMQIHSPRTSLAKSPDAGPSTGETSSHHMVRSFSDSGHMRPTSLGDARQRQHHHQRQNTMPAPPVPSSSTHLRDLTGSGLHSYPRPSGIHDSSSVGQHLQSGTSGQRKGPTEPGARYKPPPMAILDEEAASADSDTGRRKAVADLRASDNTRPGNGQPSSMGAKLLGPLRAARHESFDFERPTWNNSSQIFRSTSHGSQGSKKSGPLHPSHESLGDSQPDAAGTPSEPESSHSRGRNRRSSPGTHAAKSRSQAPTDPNSGSWGRTAGKKAPGAGVTRLVGLSHGPFAFEPPVPSPTPSNVSVSTKASQKSAVEQVMEKHRLEREREQQRERERQRELDRAMQKERRQQNIRRVDEFGALASPPPPPVQDSVPRSRKNRSLDLDLGLSWAARTIKEDALLPSVRTRGLNGRSASSSSRNGNGKRQDERSNSKAVGKEVADSFRKALGEADYDVFRRYVHRFDAHEIPFDGPNGIVARAERLLASAPNVSETRRRQLVDSLARIILQNA